MSGKVTEVCCHFNLKRAKEIIFDDNYTNPYNTDDSSELLETLSNCTVEYTAIDVVDETDEKATNISLSRMYHPDQYSYIGKALLSCCDHKFKLMVFDAKRFMLAETFEDGRNSKMTFTNDLKRSPQIMNVVAKLLTGIDEKRAKNIETLRDTQNYGFRVNAMIKNNKPFVHAEWFDNDLQEYYQMESFSGAYRVSMSRGSLFMKSYLGRDYSKYYAKEDKEPFAAFESLEDVKQLSLQENDYEKQQIWEQRLSCLCKLEAEINRTILEIMERRVFIGHSRAGISVEDLLHFYHLEKEFDCYTRKPKSFKCKGNIEITIEDLYRALELRIENVEDICTLKGMYDSLDNVFVR